MGTPHYETNQRVRASRALACAALILALGAADTAAALARPLPPHRAPLTWTVHATILPVTSYRAGQSPCGWLDETATRPFGGSRTYPWNIGTAALEDSMPATSMVAQGLPGSPFSLGDRYPLSSPGFSVAASDFDGDGRPDVAVAEANGGHLSLWFQDAAGTLAQRDTVHLDLPPIAVVAGDFDQDGHTDLAVAMNSVPGLIEILRGHGDGTFEPAGTYPAGALPAALVAGDLDQDGKIDLVVAGYGDDSITVFRNLGGGFDAGVRYACGNGPAALAIADFNRDGHPDVVAANSACRTVSVYLNRGDGRLDPRVDFLTLGPNLSVSAGDLDGDGWPDVAVTSDYDQIEVLWNDRSGAFSTESTLQQRSYQGGGVSLVDIDRDGRLDLCATSFSNWGESVATVFLGWNSRTTFQRVDYLLDNESSQGFTNCTATDLDGDGFPDLLLTGGSLVRPIVAGELAVLRHATAGVLNGLADYPLDRDVLGAFAISMDDGRPAVMIRTSGGSMLSRLDHDGRLEPPVDYPRGANALIGDWNGDGFKDVAFPDGDSLEIHESGVLPMRLARPPGSDPLLALADFDGDGRLDDLLGDPSHGLSIAFNDPGHGFTDPVPVSGPFPPLPIWGPRIVTPIDLDGDGKSDLAVGGNLQSYANGDSIVFFHHEGGGVFSRRGSIALPLCDHETCDGTVTQLLASDFDGDGWLDLFAMRGTYYGGALLWSLHNDGGTGFSIRSEPYLTISEGPTLGVRDFDHDGRPDLSIFTYNDDIGVSRFQLMLNQGAGTFDSPGTVFRLEQYVRSLSLADLNEDGKLDLVFGYGSSYGNGVSVLFDRSRDRSTACQVSLVDTRVTGSRVALRWSVRGVTGLNATVCRQAAGEAWRDVAEVTSDAANLVRFEDASLEPGHYRYRLRFRSAGQETYAGDVEVWVPVVAFALSGVTPNPSNGRLVAMFSLPSSATANFELVDISGRRVWSRRLDNPTPGTQSLDLSRGERLPSGMYWLRLNQAGRSASAKAVVLK